MPLDYITFLGFALLVVLAPGPDFAVVTKNCLMYAQHGRHPGLATSLGVVSSLLIQGAAAAMGVAALVVRSATVFTALKIVGAVYLGYLGYQALRSALSRRANQESPDVESAAGVYRATYLRVLGRGYRQGFLSNITNPKVLAFYFSLLPQFIDPRHTVVLQVLLLAATHATLALLWLIVVVAVLDRLRAFMRQPRVRRVFEGLTGIALVSFGIRLMASNEP